VTTFDVQGVWCDGAGCLVSRCLMCRVCGVTFDVQGVWCDGAGCLV